jgi:hypothetical protein
MPYNFFHTQASFLSDLFVLVGVIDSPPPSLCLSLFASAIAQQQQTPAKNKK